VWEDRECVRVLVPREFARLMGVADHLHVPAFEQAANRLYGNAVAVDVVESVVRSLMAAVSEVV
jgi:site-specific DNA-cytosine methylase